MCETTDFINYMTIMAQKFQSFKCNSYKVFFYLFYKDYKGVDYTVTVLHRQWQLYKDTSIIAAFNYREKKALCPPIKFSP